MSFTVTKWESTYMPAKVEDVCCDTLEGPRLSGTMMVLLKCTGCGQVYRNPRRNFRKIKGNPKFDATA